MGNSQGPSVAVLFLCGAVVSALVAFFVPELLAETSLGIDLGTTFSVAVVCRAGQLSVLQVCGSPRAAGGAARTFNRPRFEHGGADAGAERRLRLTGRRPCLLWSTTIRPALWRSVPGCLAPPAASAFFAFRGTRSFIAASDSVQREAVLPRRRCAPSLPVGGREPSAVAPRPRPSRWAPRLPRCARSRPRGRCTRRSAS